MQQLEDAHKKAYEKYQAIKSRLQDSSPDVDVVALAQEANDAWLKYKKVSAELQNYQFSKKMELYGC